MANSRLPASSSACNDRAALTHYFSASFDYRLQPTVPGCYTDYLRTLRAVVGLGFTAVLAENHFLTQYQAPLQRFINHDSGDFRHRSSAKPLLAEACAEMVLLAVDCFSYLGYPPYYSVFVAVLEQALRGLLLTEHYTQARRFLDELQRKIPSW